MSKINEIVKFTIPGEPKGKGRPKFSRQGNFVKTYTPETTVNYENWVKLCYQQQGGKRLEGPIRARVIAYYKVPKSYTKKRVQAIREGLEQPTKKPDADNIAKIILDSLNKIAFDDDSQVVELTVIKRWTEEFERVEFELEVIE